MPETLKVEKDSGESFAMAAALCNGAEVPTFWKFRLQLAEVFAYSTTAESVTTLVGSGWSGSSAGYWRQKRTALYTLKQADQAWKDGGPGMLMALCVPSSCK